LPDAKTQVTIEFEDHKPLRVDTIVISNQHRDIIDLETLKADIKREVIDHELGDMIDENTILHINPTGRFVIG
jgi:S-adenosylmethionine synthetase